MKEFELQSKKDNNIHPFVPVMYGNVHRSVYYPTYVTIRTSSTVHTGTYVSTYAGSIYYGNTSTVVI